MSSLLFETALVFVRFDHVASRIVNANHSIVHVSDGTLYENWATPDLPNSAQISYKMGHITRI
jgi:hypothetical protein